jgi:hypothetical protein
MKSRLPWIVSAVVFASLSFAAVAAADDVDQLAAREQVLWKAWQDHEAAPFQEHLADNAVNVTTAGLSVGKEKQIADITSSDCKVASFALGDIATHRFGDSTVVLTYTATQDATCDGNKLAPKVQVSSVWVKQGDRWLAAAYHESPLPE